ncbi:MAG: hypothetical protein FJX53_03260 [Alphaproteobacteria bacterium]|nr:hypothetical protein [Alphaproteobacteria bacterium]
MTVFAWRFLPYLMFLSIPIGSLGALTAGLFWLIARPDRINIGKVHGGGQSPSLGDSAEAPQGNKTR